MIKRIVKSVLWRTGISRTVPPMIWKSMSEGGPISFLYEQVRYPKFPVNFEDAEISNSFTEQNASYAKVKDFVLEVQGPALIEPKLGIVILNNGKFLEQSRNHTYTYPDTFQYLKYKAGLVPVIELDEVIHYDGYVGDNYYNFHADILIAFCWAVNEAGLKLDKPVVVGQQIYNSRQFQWLLKNTDFFKAIKWVVLDGRSYVRVKKLYKAWTFLPELKAWQNMAALYNPPAVAEPMRRVYLYRAPQFGRTVKNIEEIKPVLDKYGFEMIDTGEMPIEKQVELFAETKYLVAIHGAGIINIIFSNYNKLSLLEILPGREKLNTHFYWLAESLGCKYDALLTEDMNMAKKFRLEPEVLEHHIKKMLANS
ncbi:MAG: glycosyltransferase family 61 protein [Flavipsychrobacter sp.]